MIHSHRDTEQAQSLDRLPELTEDEARSVTGGGDCYNIYYNVETGRYIGVPKGEVFYQPGTLATLRAQLDGFLVKCGLRKAVAYGGQIVADSDQQPPPGIADFTKPP